MLFYKKKVRNVTISILWNHTWTNDAMINLKVNTVCCKKICRVLIVPSLTQWHQSSLNEMKRPVTAAVPVWNPQTLWSSSWNGARRAHGRLSSLCLALPLPCGWCLASSSACVTFYGHISCLGSGLWTSSKPMGSELISYHWQRKDVTCKQIQVKKFYMP